jgi:predicted aspartyl protease
VDVAVDTGFTDYLTLNRELISRLGLMFVGVSVAELADGAEVELEEYLVRV